MTKKLDGRVKPAHGEFLARYQPSLFEDAPQESGGPEGFAYRDDFLSRAEEDALVEAFAALPFAPFQFHQYVGNRRVVSFGFSYDYAARELGTAVEMPDFLLPIRARAAAFAGRAPEDFVQALITEYAPGAGIGWHRDKPVYGDVVGISIKADCVLRFRKAVAGAPAGRTKFDRYNVHAAARSIYLLRGAARQEWYHSIAPLREMRYSVTFRSLA